MNKKGLWFHLAITTLSLITLSKQNLVLAFADFEVQKSLNLKCSRDTLTSKAKPPFVSGFNFADQLHFETNSSRIVAQFKPRDQQKQPMELEELANDLGYQSFNWVNYVEQDPYGMIDHTGQKLSLPYNDPPPGGYKYEPADRYPFYWDVEKCHNCRFRHHLQHPQVQQKNSLTFEDSPSDYRLRPGETIDFVTHLVGVKNDGDLVSWDVLHTFKWQLSNTATGRGQVTLTAKNLTSLDLASSTLAQIKSDGGTIPQSIGDSLVAGRDKYNSHSPQCQPQSHQSPHPGGLL